MRPRPAPAAPALMLALMVAGCPKAAPEPQLPPQESEAEQLSPLVRQLSEETEALLKNQDELLWRHWTLGAPLELSRSYHQHQTLFRRENVQLLERARALATSPEEERSLLHLKVYLAGEILSRAIAEHTLAIANLEASLTFSAGGRDHPYRELARLLANEPNEAKRRALYEGATAAVERLTFSLRRKEERLAQAVEELGYRSYEAYGAELRQADFDQLADLAQEALRATEASYREAMERISRRELGPNARTARRADFPRLFRARGQETSFPAEKLRGRVEATLVTMGLELTLPNLRLDLSDAPEKKPRPLVLPLAVPGDVRVSMRLRGGESDQSRLLHEVGHALQLALSRPVRFELGRLGNGIVGEALAFLLESLIEEPEWLGEHAGLDGERLDQAIETTRAQRLLELRRAAGGLLYELACRRGHPDPRELYREMIGRTYAITLTQEEAARFLVEAEDFYPQADALVAMLLAAQVKAHLQERYGRAFWKNAQVGPYLVRLFQGANGVSPEEVAQRAGYSGLEVRLPDR